MFQEYVTCGADLIHIYCLEILAKQLSSKPPSVGGRKTGNLKIHLLRRFLHQEYWPNFEYRSVKVILYLAYHSYECELSLLHSCTDKDACRIAEH